MAVQGAKKLQLSKNVLGLKKLMKVDELKQAGRREKEAAVGDEEMAYRFKNIVGLHKLKKKWDHMGTLMDSMPDHSSYKKSKKNGIKTTFLKPKDD